mmetsp:Transcript_57487/g.115409  ORF Transcript_57487/g.115409 Transcript_57487/m.115409 type:complete len:208 (-) Transcript_57487:154-777(-)
MIKHAQYRKLKSKNRIERSTAVTRTRRSITRSSSSSTGSTSVASCCMSSSSGIALKSCTMGIHSRNVRWYVSRLQLSKCSTLMFSSVVSSSMAGISIFGALLLLLLFIFPPKRFFVSFVFLMTSPLCELIEEMELLTDESDPSMSVLDDFISVESFSDTFFPFSQVGHSEFRAFVLSSKSAFDEFGSLATPSFVSSAAAPSFEKLVL